MKKKIGIIAVLVVLFDQISKYLVIKNFKIFESIEIIKNFFSLTYIRNYGGAWGVFQGNVLLLALISFLALTFFIKMIFKEQNMNTITIITYGLLLGGIIGNLIDRVIRGYVIDFLDFYILGYDYPVFNVADIMIVISVLLLIFEILRSEYNENRSRKK